MGMQAARFSWRTWSTVGITEDATTAGETQWNSVVGFWEKLMEVYTYFPFCFCIMKASLQRYIATLDCYSSFSGHLWSQDLNTWKHHVTRDQWHCHGSNFPSFSSVWLYAESGSFVLGVDVWNHFSFSETFVPPGQLKDHHFPFNSSCFFDGYPGWNWKQIAWEEPFRRGLKTWCVRFSSVC